MDGSVTAGIIIIGNEILSGKVRDVNSYYLACELRTLGVDVRRITVIPDEIEIIGRAALEFSEQYDYVFTSGGVGPTHDDVTMAGVAKGFNTRLIVHPEVKNILSSRYKRDLNSSVVKMAEVPDGSEIIFESNMRFPVILYRNIFIFPGIPEYLKTKFAVIKERFRTSEFFLKKLFLNAHESDFAEILNRIVEENPEVQFGSYPVTGDHEHRVYITIESKSALQMEQALKDLIVRLPEDIIVRIE